MMRYDYRCDTCEYTVEVRQSMENADSVHLCITCGNTMRRLYGGAQRAIVQLDVPGYVEKAYRGEEKVPNMTTRQVRAIVDSDVKTRRKGFENRRNYGDRRH